MALQYPTGSFTAECERVAADQIQGGWRDPGDQLILKCTFPAFELSEAGQDFQLDTALMLGGTSIRDDLLTALYPQVTLKGFGIPHNAPKQSSSSLLQHSIDFGVSQMGFGSSRNLFRTLMNRYYKVRDSINHIVPLQIKDESFGAMHMKTKILTSPKHLMRNGFPEPEPETTGTTGIVYTNLKAKFTSEQVKRILESAHHVNRKYGSPRIILRMNYPESMFNNIGTTPSAEFHTEFTGSNMVNADRTIQHVSLEPVRYVKD